MRAIRKILKFHGYKIIKIEAEDPIINNDKEFIKIYNKCKEYTMTSKERMYALYSATKYIINSNISGDFVECGVWKGGSAMVIAMTLKNLRITNRNIILYDTFEGMSEPTSKDYSIKTKESAKKIWLRKNKTWISVSQQEVEKNMNSTKYPRNNIKYIKGKVEDTIPNTIPKKIALLRCDTDFYKSTKHELEHLFPILTINGVLIIDDYGSWAGSKKAVDEYIKKKKIKILLNRIDNQGEARLAIKTTF